LHQNFHAAQLLIAPTLTKRERETKMDKFGMDSLIVRALNDTLSIDEACVFLSSLNEQTDTEIKNIAHAVVHFLTDKDIRKYDQNYDQSQRVFLSNKLHSLHSISNITFDPTTD
jgi:hypothetical protein